MISNVLDLPVIALQWCKRQQMKPDDAAMGVLLEQSPHVTTGLACG